MLREIARSGAVYPLVMASPARWLCLLFVLVTSTGCTWMRYVTQASAGQEDLSRRAVDIAPLLERDIDHNKKALLERIAPIKAFGERHGLRPTRNYTKYVNLQRPQVIWVVTACDPLRFRPKSFWFPVVGSISYLGWFDRKDADAFGGDLREDGWDVDIRPSHAYSTLGWFEDPVLSTMFSDGEGAIGELANVILHESLHATFYVPGQSTLNESVASFFGDKLGLVYLKEIGGEEGTEAKLYVEGEKSREKRAELMRGTYLALETLYASRLPRAEKLARKAHILRELRASLRVRRPITNATLIQYKTYGSGKAELEALLDRCGGSFERLLVHLEGARKHAEKSHTDPAEILKPLLSEPCR
jgi:predicted aminopeptidase